MTWNQISMQWRWSLVVQLQERYGLEQEEAIRKTDALLQWIGKQPVEDVAQHPMSRQGSLMRPGKSRSRASGHSSTAPHGLL
jgi:hypothetical protein